MLEIDISILLAGVIAGAAPVLLATLGETITERVGIVNLSLDGTILLSAMTAFVVAYHTNSMLLGFSAAALVGGLVALIVAIFSVYLGQSQVAVGFVLTLMTRDLAYFLGSPYARLNGPQALPFPVPILKDLPFIGSVFFSHSLPVYLSLIGIFFCWWYLFRTPMGLTLRSVGENPAAAYARGINPGAHQLGYAFFGGLLVGLAGATFSLAIKPGWGRPQGAEGTGWIALALVIFGGWHPIRAAFGAYLFAFLQIIGIYLQGWLPSVPTQVFQVAPFPLMIFTLLVISYAQKASDKIVPGGNTQTRPAGERGRGWLYRLLRVLTGNAPAALGQPFRPE
jgi:simple sugar transport system permease protein